MGTSFRWLLASTWVTNIGDGIALAVGPLLVASLTDQPALIALAATVQWLPPLLFGLLAGVASDRLDRRGVMIVVNAVRVVVVALLGAAVLTGHATIAGVLLALFVLGTAEVFVDNTASTLLPMLVHRDDLAVANSRLYTGIITFNQLAGPPIGAAIFVAGTAYPFLVQAVAVALGVVLVSRLRLPPHGRDPETVGRVVHDIAEGFRFVRHHAAVRTLVLTILIFNLTFGAAWSVLVLYATERLDMGAVGFGLLTTTSAVGGLLATLGYGALTRRVGLGDLMRVGLVVETLVHLVLALTTSPAVALVTFFVFGAHAFIWGTTSVTVRQRAVPSHLQGRVGGVNLVACFGGLVIGSGLGGVLAQHWGVTAPFWFAFAGSAVFVVAIWGQLHHIAHADATPVADEPGPRAVV
ncbi:MFS transporter [Nocardioides sp. SOB77]|uniref:MFS transporter n=1 Tax=Nocardioides oceani TaxID=3058369 RepID=A0ABT8FF78_9ACTN|nr:MFS transporter [Nocardioides oceani]MDN4172827.1 MFS transporter [Nocardioides oceani]